MTTKTKSKPIESVLESKLGPFTFAMFMRSIRTTLNLSQVAMAKLLGISKQSICDLEKGRTTVTPETASRYAKRAGFSEAVAVEASLQDQLRKAKLDYTIKLARGA